VRCFLAVDLPAPVRNHLAKTARSVQSSCEVKWVAADKLHLTLLFAGALPDQNVEALCELVRELDVPPLRLSLSGLGHFPPRGLPRVIWAAVDGDVEALAAMHREIDERARPLGVEREKRGFTPHITLGRVTGQFGALALVDAIGRLGQSLNKKPFVPTELVLYRSELRPGGAVHEALVRRPIPPFPAVGTSDNRVR